MRFLTHVHRNVSFHFIIVTIITTVKFVNSRVKTCLIYVLQLSATHLTVELLGMTVGDSYSSRLTCYKQVQHFRYLFMMSLI